MYKKILIPFLSLICFLANAQTQFIQKGRIEFEKKVNQFKPFENEDNDNPWMKEMMKTLRRMFGLYSSTVSSGIRVAFATAASGVEAGTETESHVNGNTVRASIP